MKAEISKNELYITWQFDRRIFMQDGPGGVYISVTLSAEDSQELLESLDAIRAQVRAMQIDEDRD